jgi:hypothetical protein
VEYQLKRYNGVCSYKWNEEYNVIEFNEHFYKTHNIPIPKVKKI